MSKLNSIVAQCGTVKVHLAPLLIIVGAAMAASNDVDIELMVEMLDVEQEPYPCTCVESGCLCPAQCTCGCTPDDCQCPITAEHSE